MTEIEITQSLEINCDKLNPELVSYFKFIDSDFEVIRKTKTLLRKTKEKQVRGDVTSNMLDMFFQQHIKSLFESKEELRGFIFRMSKAFMKIPAFSKKNPWLIHILFSEYGNSMEKGISKFNVEQITESEKTYHNMTLSNWLFICLVKMLQFNGLSSLYHPLKKEQRSPSIKFNSKKVCGIIDIIDFPFRVIRDSDFSLGFICSFSRECSESEVDLYNEEIVNTNSYINYLDMCIKMAVKDISTSKLTKTTELCANGGTRDFSDKSSSYYLNELILLCLNNCFHGVDVLDCNTLLTYNQYIQHFHLEDVIPSHLINASDITEHKKMFEVDYLEPLEKHISSTPKSKLKAISEMSKEEIVDCSIEIKNEIRKDKAFTLYESAANVLIETHQKEPLTKGEHLEYMEYKENQIFSEEDAPKMNFVFSSIFDPEIPFKRHEFFDIKQQEVIKSVFTHIHALRVLFSMHKSFDRDKGIPPHLKASNRQRNYVWSILNGSSKDSLLEAALLDCTRTTICYWIGPTNPNLLKKLVKNSGVDQPYPYYANLFLGKACTELIMTSISQLPVLPLKNNIDEDCPVLPVKDAHDYFRNCWASRVIFSEIASYATDIESYMFCELYNFQNNPHLYLTDTEISALCHEENAALGKQKIDSDSFELKAENLFGCSMEEMSKGKIKGAERVEGGGEVWKPLSQFVTDWDTQTLEEKMQHKMEKEKRKSRAEDEINQKSVSDVLFPSSENYYSEEEDNDAPTTTEETDEKDKLKTQKFKIHYLDYNDAIIRNYLVDKRKRAIYPRFPIIIRSHYGYLVSCLALDQTTKKPIARTIFSKDPKDKQLFLFDNIIDAMCFWLNVISQPPYCQCMGEHKIDLLSQFFANKQ